MFSDRRRKNLSVESLEDRRLLTVPNFALQDLNPASDTFGDAVSVSDFAGRTTAWYFGDAG